MPDLPPPEQHTSRVGCRFQFGMATLLLVVLAVSIAMAFWAAMTSSASPLVQVLYFVIAAASPVGVVVVGSLLVAIIRRGRRNRP